MLSYFRFFKNIVLPFIFLFLLFSVIHFYYLDLLNFLKILINTLFLYGYVEDILEFFATFLPIFISVIYFTHAERKVQAAIQRRRGPNVISFWGFLQPFADGIKLLFKETIYPHQAGAFLFFFAPMFTFGISLVNWSVLPFSFNGPVSDNEFSLLIVYAVSSFGVYGIFLAGWASNSRYAFFGAIRSIIQLISYEIVMGFVYVIIAINMRTLRLSDIVIQQEQQWNFLPFFSLSFIFLVTILAETNRAPFDLPESEGELVAGYNLEYTSFVFSLFFLGEYSNMLFMSALITTLFFGGWLSFSSISFSFSVFVFAFKITIFAYLYILIRSVYPRLRYDQLMYLCWNIFLPYLLIELSFCILTSEIYVWLPFFFIFFYFLIQLYNRWAVILKVRSISQMGWSPYHNSLIRKSFSVSNPDVYLFSRFPENSFRKIRLLQVCNPRTVTDIYDPVYWVKYDRFEFTIDVYKLIFRIENKKYN